MRNKYTPIACSLYDALESAAVRKTLVEIRFNNTHKRLFIRDLRTRHQIEYLIGCDALSGEEFVIRLDQIEAIDDVSTNKPLATGERA
ncbi:MAG: hypothetical protein IH628_18285 [Proteobacteria bacterium]|nr:hypothetical protein [Pseudomonadota bacterium]